MWFKKILAYSAALTGSCLYFDPKGVYINCCPNEEMSAGSESPSSYIYISDNIDNDFDKNTVAFWEKNSIPVYWKLLMLCKSKDQKVRHKAIKSLSKSSSFEKWEYMMIAQAADVRTCIALSRNIDASPYFFLPPPFRDLKEGNLQSDLFQWMSLLPSTNDVCIENLRKLVLKFAKSLVKSEYSVDLEVGDPSVLFHSQQKKKSVFLFNKYILKMFLCYSTRSSYRNTMIKNGILEVLLKVWKCHENEPEILSLIGQILANIALEEKFTKIIYMSGWIGILASWAKSSNISISLPASKALANLDEDDISHSVYDDGLYVLNPIFRQSQTEPIADIIFVHGLLGATFWTWRQCDTQRNTLEMKSRNKSKENVYELKNSSSSYSMCWPKDWLTVDFPLLRILSVDYQTCISKWSSECFQEKEKNNISKTSRELINKLLLSNVGERPIIWIGHSMGGLIVKQILADAIESNDEKIKLLALRTSGIVFFSVPHKGSELANKINSASHIFLPSSDIAQLEKGSQNLFLLHEKFKSIVSKHNISVLSFGETKPTQWGLSLSVLVSADSSDPGVGEFYTLPCDHLSTCKPVSPNSFEYLKILQFLQTNLCKTSTCDSYPMKLSKTVFEMSKVLCLIP